MLGIVCIIGSALGGGLVAAILSIVVLFGLSKLDNDPVGGGAYSFLVFYVSPVAFVLGAAVGAAIYLFR